MSRAAADDVVRTSEECVANGRAPLLVLDPLRTFLDEHGIGDGDLRAEPIGEGHSNVTYAIRRDGADVVLRRPPRPPWPPSAHDVLREARILRALQDTPARVPRVLAVCEDPELIGAPFYLMEKVDGHVISRELPPELDTPRERQRIGEEFVDALVEVHAIDWQATSLAGLGRPAGYLERQLRRFSALWEHNKTRDVADVDRVAAWLAEHMPPSPPATVVHGDYRLGNTMLHPEAPARIVAILDWEMATIGDPLADLGYLCALWADPDDPPLAMFELNPVTRQPGFPRREQLIARYAERSGHSPSDIRWYQTLALWKALIFMEGNHRRALTGTTDDPFLKSFGDGVLELAGRAMTMCAGDP
ncbi:MAG: hypothetical protein V7607_4522 [Solirubrobacteraceae bacterium]